MRKHCHLVFPLVVWRTYGLSLVSDGSLFVVVSVNLQVFSLSFCTKGDQCPCSLGFCPPINFGILELVISSWKFLAECNVSVMIVLFVNKWKLLLIRALSVCFSFFLMVFKESAFHRRSEDKRTRTDICKWPSILFKCLNSFLWGEVGESLSSDIWPLAYWFNPTKAPFSHQECPTPPLSQETCRKMQKVPIKWRKEKERGSLCA